MSDYVAAAIECPWCEEQIMVELRPETMTPDQCECGWDIQIENPEELYNELKEHAREEHLLDNEKIRRESPDEHGY